MRRRNPPCASWGTDMPFGWVEAGAAVLGAANSMGAFGGGGSGAQNEATSIAQEQINLANVEQQQSTGLYNRYMDTYVPLQNQYITDVQNANTENSPDAAANRAMADVQASSNNENQQLTRQMAGYGINPASGRFQNALRLNALGTAGQMAGAANSARQYAVNENLARLGVIANMGNGLIGESQSGAGLGLQGLNGPLNYFNSLAGQQNWLSQQQGQQAGLGLSSLLGGLGGLFGPSSTNSSSIINSDLAPYENMNIAQPITIPTFGGP